MQICFPHAAYWPLFQVFVLREKIHAGDRTAAEIQASDILYHCFAS